MTIKELRELLNRLELESNSEDTPVYFRDTAHGNTAEVAWGYTETDEDGNEYAILREWNG